MNSENNIESTGALCDPPRGCTDSIDPVPLESRAETAQVEPGFEALDLVAAKVAIDLEQRITSLVIVPTVAVEVSATVDPDADPLMTRLGAMTTSELTTYIKDEIALGEGVLADEKLAADEHKRIKGQRLQVTYEVICALRELKSRCKATKTWEKALKECGIAPSTWRSWDCRELNQLTTGKRTKSRKPKPDGRSLAQIQADVAAARAAVDARRAAAMADQLETNPLESEYVDSPAPDATAPDKLDPSVSKLNAEPDWKHVLIELIAVLEQFGDRLPLAVLSKKCTIEKLLEGKDLPLAARKVSQHSGKRYQKPKKVDSEGNGYRVVKAKGEKEALETVDVESIDDKAVAHLNSPAVSLSDIGAAARMLPASVTLDWRRILGPASRCGLIGRMVTD